MSSLQFAVQLAQCGAQLQDSMGLGFDTPQGDAGSQLGLRLGKFPLKAGVVSLAQGITSNFNSKRSTFFLLFP